MTHAHPTFSPIFSRKPIMQYGSNKYLNLDHLVTTGCLLLYARLRRRGARADETERLVNNEHASGDNFFSNYGKLALLINRYTFTYKWGPTEISVSASFGFYQK